ncbi:hypothetical protein SDC9_146028 [bioreactor metagenome]|uniref:Uncharacterized protein n=1 Tax=bioreactor metagenome TaxID=1076179 RepID=A0A645ECL3_9ZZZZ
MHVEGIDKLFYVAADVAIFAHHFLKGRIVPHNHAGFTDGGGRHGSGHKPDRAGFKPCPDRGQRPAFSGTACHAHGSIAD